jgi:GNAT superfamily N-acetyltransferase
MDALPSPTSAANTTTTVPTAPTATDRVQRILAGPVLEAIYRLRLDAWAADGVFFSEMTNGRFIDVLDTVPDAEHYGYLDAGMPVAAIRVSVHDSNASMMFPESLQTSLDASPLGLVSRLAVHRDWRRIGLGYTLIDFAVDRLKEVGVNGIIAWTPVSHVTRYFESKGFTVYRTAAVKWGERNVPAAAFSIAF